MTGEQDKKRMLDAVEGLKVKTRSEAVMKLDEGGNLNKGTQKALDEFYNYARSKNGNVVYYTQKGQLRAQNAKGQFRSTKGLEILIKRLEEMRGKK